MWLTPHGSYRNRGCFVSRASWVFRSRPYTECVKTHAQSNESLNRAVPSMSSRMSRGSWVLVEIGADQVNHVIVIASRNPSMLTPLFHCSDIIIFQLDWCCRRKTIRDALSLCNLTMPRNRFTFKYPTAALSCWKAFQDTQWGAQESLKQTAPLNC